MSVDELGNVKDTAGSLRDIIRSSFPQEKFNGKVTPVDGEWTTGLDDEQALYEQLKGRRWTEIPSQFVRDHPGDIVLLTNEAFAAFLPAWLERALDDPAGENPVRDYLVYTFSPKRDLVPDTTSMIGDRLRSLTQEQRLAVRAVIEQFASHDSSKFIRTQAAHAVALIEEFTNDAPHRLI